MQQNCRWANLAPPHPIGTQRRVIATHTRTHTHVALLLTHLILCDLHGAGTTLLHTLASANTLNVPFPFQLRFGAAAPAAPIISGDFEARLRKHLCRVLRIKTPLCSPLIHFASPSANRRLIDSRLLGIQTHDSARWSHFRPGHLSTRCAALACCSR